MSNVVRRGTSAQAQGDSTKLGMPGLAYDLDLQGRSCPSTWITGPVGPVQENRARRPCAFAAAFHPAFIRGRRRLLAAAGGHGRS